MIRSYPLSFWSCCFIHVYSQEELLKSENHRPHTDLLDEKDNLFAPGPSWLCWGPFVFGRRVCNMAERNFSIRIPLFDINTQEVFPFTCLCSAKKAGLNLQLVGSSQFWAFQQNASLSTFRILVFASDQIIKFRTFDFTNPFWNSHSPLSWGNDCFNLKMIYSTYNIQYVSL